MVDIDVLKQEFWDGEYKKEIYKFDDEGVKASIMRALGDFTDRTTQLKLKFRGQSFGVERKFRVLCGTDGQEHDAPEAGSFVDGFIKYFKSNYILKNQEEFDQWHYEMCVKFLSVFDDIYENIAYGKAQKIVNMTFKNVYCLEDEKGGERQNIKERYTFCHMPLDSFILEWFNRTQAWLKSKPYGVNIDEGDIIAKPKIPSWSKMQFSDQVRNGEIDLYGYKSLQNAIRKYLKEYAEKNKATRFLKDHTPFEAEFFVWKYIQIELAAEGIYNQLISFDMCETGASKKDFKNKSINEKLDFLKDLFKDIDRYKVEN